MDKYVVTRQSRWIDGVQCVEIARGGRDYSGPDALCGKYDGEFEEFTDPREAVRVGLEIAKQWRKDSKEKIRMVFGSNLDMFVGDDISIWNAERTFPRIARELYEKAEKCNMCGELLPEEHFTDEFGEGKYCREYCAEKAYAELYPETEGE